MTFPKKVIDPNFNDLMHYTVSLVCSDAVVRVEDIYAPTQLSAQISLSRQIIMYLSNVVYGFSKTDIANFIGRDRTTVRHGVEKIEDARDRNTFDEKLDNFEVKMIDYKNRIGRAA